MSNLTGRAIWWLFGKWRHHYREWRASRSSEPRAYPVWCDVTSAQCPCGCALLCYVVDPFLDGYDQVALRAHSNHWHAREIVSALAERGYRVDVTDYRNVRAPDGRTYDVVIGLDTGFASACRRARHRSPPVKLLLGTGAHTDQVKQAESARLDALRNRRGATCARRYRTRPDPGPAFADAIAVVGSQWVMDTYRQRSSAPVYQIPNTIVDGVVPVLQGKDFRLARRRFLWLASYAAVHRGLDVCLEVFSQEPELELWVYGSIAHERDFTQLYHRELHSCPNIHFGGWVDVTSDAFRDTARRCGYALYPSASDGMPGSVVNSMAAGLVPLVTVEAGMDTGGFGETFPECTPECVRQVVLRASQRDPGNLAREAASVVEFTHRRYSKEAFRRAFSDCLDAVLKVRGSPDAPS